MVPALSLQPVGDADEQRFLLHGVSWDEYTALLRAFGDRPALRTTYLDGALELMSPSGPHEAAKKIFARLLETYADVGHVNLNGSGSETFRKKAALRGLEPDECYFVGARRGMPHLAIEVICSRARIDKLEVYRGLGVREVWRYRRGVLSIHVLERSRYVERSHSVVLPDLDLDLLLRFVRPDEDQTPLVRAYRKALRAAMRG